jgi:hypothetical protein
MQEFKTPILRSGHQEGIGQNEWQLPTTTVSCNTFPGYELQFCEENGSIPSVSSVYGETEFLSSMGLGLGASNPSNADVDAILHHSLYGKNQACIFSNRSQLAYAIKCISTRMVFVDAMQSTVLMSTHLLAFLLLNKFRSGVSQNLLAEEMRALSREIREKYKHDIGFSGNFEDVVQNAVSLRVDFGQSIDIALLIKIDLDQCRGHDVLSDSNLQFGKLEQANLLGASLVSVGSVDGQVFLKPVAKKACLVKLGYYSNHVLSLFAMEGAIGKYEAISIYYTYMCPASKYLVGEQESILILQIKYRRKRFEDARLLLPV